MTLHHIPIFPNVEAAADDHAPKKLGEEPYIHKGTVIFDSQVGSWTEIGPNSVLAETIFDDYSYAAGDNSMIYAHIGKFCSIASHVRINPGNHPMERVTQHHMTYRRKQYGFAETDDDAFFQWRRDHACNIGHDVWLGHNVVVMPGVRVGIGAVVGSGAVVTKNVDPYTIVVGVPAKPIRKRFSDAQIEKLLAIAWWDWDRTTLESRFADLNDLPSFLEKYSG